MSSALLSPTFRYLGALGAVALALALQWATWPMLQPTPYMLFYLVSMVISWKFGVGPGLLVVAVSLVAVDLLFLPGGGISSYGFGAVAPILTAVAVVVLVGSLSAAQRRSQHELGDSEERFRTIVSTASEGIWTLDIEGRITYLNERLAQLLRYSVDEMLGRDYIDFLFEDERPRAEALIRTLKRGERQKQDLRLRRKDSTALWVVFSSSPIYRNGLFVGTLAMIADVTERRLAEQALREANDELEDRVATRTAELASANEALKNEIVERRRAEHERESLIREQAAVAAQETERLRLAFLVEAGSVLAASLDFETTLSNLATLSVPMLADWCVIDIREEDGSIRTIASAHAKPQFQGVVERLRGPWSGSGSFDPSAPHADDEIPAVIATARARIVAPLDPGSSARLNRGSEFEAVASLLGISSAMLVPLVSRGAAFGAISFFLSDNRHRHLEADLTLAQELAGRATQAIESARMFAAEQSARSENERLYESAQRANRAKDEFLATVSHEIRTPLNAILGWAQLLKGGDLDSETALHALDAIERNARAQAQLIEDLLDVSRIIAGKLILEIKQVDLVTILSEAADAVRPAADARSVTIDIHPGPESLIVNGDPHRLRQVVLNLLSNAVKFSQHQGSVGMSLSVEAQVARLEVTDSGVGISPDFLPFVFDRFQQSDRTIARSKGGLGLGLGIVETIVHMHGGTVRATSEGEGKGATFIVCLPFDPQVPDRTAGGGTTGTTSDGGSPDAGRRTGSRVLEQGSSKVLQGVRIVAVDDEPDARELLQALLGGHGATVRLCSSAAEALAEIRAWKPDLIVSDIGMPDEDGCTLIENVRSLGDLEIRSTPAIALTAFARSEDRERVLSAGYQQHVPKPVEAEQLLRQIVELLGIGRSG